nr:FAD binding domain-containing protein [Paraburkholderia humisilvae]
MSLSFSDEGDTRKSPLRRVVDAIPALAQLANVIADPQVRDRGTMGGSIETCTGRALSSVDVATGKRGRISLYLCKPK